MIHKIIQLRGDVMVWTRYWVIGRCLVICLPLNAAFAQDAPPLALEEIVVTAQKRSENIQNVPITVSAFSGPQLESLHVTDNLALQQVTPGVVLGTNTTFGEFYIRGVGNSNGTPYAESPVAMYVDGVNYSDVSSMMLMMPNVERVEVLQGPQGTLYGRNATAGAINVITKQPTPGFAADVKVSYGNFDDREYAAYLNDGSETLMFNMSASSQARNATYENLDIAGPQGLSALERNSARAKVRWLLASNIDLTLAVDYSSESDSGLGYQQAYPASPGLVSTGQLLGGRTSLQPWQTYINSPMEDHAQQKGVALAALVTFDGFEVKSITAYRADRLNDAFDADTTDADVQHYWFYSIHNQFSQEVQFLSTGDGNLSWTGGLYFLHEDAGFDPIGIYVLGDNITVSGLVNGKTYAAFGEATYKLSAAWTLVAGLRYTQDKKELYDSAVNGTPFPSNDHTWDKVTPRLALQYRRPEGMYYANVSQGYKAGVYNATSPSATNNPVNPETLTAEEVGAKWSFAEDRVRLNVAAFNYDYKNLQVFSLASNSTTTLTNAATAKIKGGNLDLTALVTSALTFRMGLAYLNSKYGTFTDASINAPNPAQSLANPLTLITTVGDLSGHTTPRAPTLTSTVGVDWKVPLQLRGAVTLSANWYHSDSYYLQVPGLHAEGYDLLSAGLNYKTPDKHWTFGAWGANLTNKAYVQDAVDNAYGRFVNYADPRTYGGYAEYSF
jgi:iron complex outermembrane recepter protein